MKHGEVFTLASGTIDYLSDPITCKAGSSIDETPENHAGGYPPTCGFHGNGPDANTPKGKETASAIGGLGPLLAYGATDHPVDYTDERKSSIATLGPKLLVDTSPKEDSKCRTVDGTNPTRMADKVLEEGNHDGYAGPAI